MSTTPIGAITPNPLAAAANAGTTAGDPTPKPAGSSSLADENTFLKLLVAQLKNQDPQNPADGTQFVTQLAQFSGLEQQLGMKTDLDQILTLLKAPAQTPAPAAPPASA